MIIIDKQKCIGCKKCVDFCPFTVLEMTEGKAQLVEGKGCIKCLHCAAVCPKKAISFGEMEGTLEVELAELPINFSKLLETHVMTRRSYRHFKDTPVDREVLNHALWLASWAPSAKNQHPTNWIVIDNKELIEQIMLHILNYVKETGTSPEVVSEYEAGNNCVMGTAPTLLLGYAKNNKVNPLADTSIALTTIELLLQAQAIGTCWAGYLTRFCNAIPQLKELLELPEGSSFYAALMLGYPDKEAYPSIPERVKKQEVKWL
ncbi:nitroreductase family protein [Clostridium aminobutyricum]|uniref:Nitroreductase family protein n=1 Tax=Clostridium aminobutyricum TaxID=33953 RepID=A0A939D6U1_CLOAM|nr:nitroreductase family protein [Clostridium aminobutyricum]MBN7771908.1 nitroreductase family protein [Clostridium aminobutyricum]